ncbi:MAG: phosphotransferase [Lachnospiraceae bacterium]|nr:phosphotransferase [Lachnospiraceae bacterium]
MRELSIDGASKIGEGAHGEVYQISEDTIVKVFRPFVTMDEIQREKELAKWALIKRLPTAISFDIVKVGESYGVVYEMLDACSTSDFIQRSDENFDMFIEKSVELLKRIHSVSVSDGELPDMKEKYLQMAEVCRTHLSDECYGKLINLINGVPDSHTLLHADYHLKNIMISRGRLMLIDMDTLCYGDPIFDLASIYNSYRQFPSISPNAAAFLGIDVDMAYRIWERMLDAYLGDVFHSRRDDVERKAQILGCVRIIDFAERRMKNEEGELCINVCTGDISDRLDTF